MSTDPHAPTPAGPDPEPTPTVRPDEATAEHPVGTAAPEGDWLADPRPTAPAPEPAIPTPGAFTPPGTPEPESRVDAATEAAGQAAAQAQSALERPEVQVGLAFAGGAVLSFLLRGLGR